MAWDLTNAIMDRLVVLFTQDMQTNIPLSDPLRLKHIEKAPPQFDPTQRAPYVLIGIDQQYGRVLDPVHEMDVGGPLRWMSFFFIKGRVPRQANREDAYHKIGILNDRALRVVIRHHDLDSLVAENGEQVIASTKKVIRKNLVHAIGGETEWYAEFGIWCYWFSEESAYMSDTPGGEFVN